MPRWKRQTSSKPVEAEQALVGIAGGKNANSSAEDWSSGDAQVSKPTTEQRRRVEKSRKAVLSSSESGGLETASSLSTSTAPSTVGSSKQGRTKRQPRAVLRATHRSRLSVGNIAAQTKPDMMPSIKKSGPGVTRYDREERSCSPELFEFGPSRSLKSKLFDSERRRIAVDNEENNRLLSSSPELTPPPPPSESTLKKWLSENRERNKSGRKQTNIAPVLTKWNVSNVSGTSSTVCPSLPTNSNGSAAITLQPVRRTHHRKVIMREQPVINGKLISEYFPVRKSHRMCESKLKENNEHRIILAVTSGKEIGLEVRVLSDKGRAVFATMPFEKDDFVVEYAGELMSQQEAKKRECMYSENQSVGCFMYYFRYLCKSYCIDATKETNRLGRLINHSRYDNNLNTRVISSNGYPHLILVANRHISLGEELLYDYGDRSKASLKAHPWLRC